MRCRIVVVKNMPLLYPSGRRYGIARRNLPQSPIPGPDSGQLLWSSAISPMHSLVRSYSVL